MRPARAISLDTPVAVTPTTTEGGANPARTISTDRRAIADMRSANLGFAPCQYFTVMIPIAESRARLLVAATVSSPCAPVEMDKRDIASAFRSLRIQPVLPLVMRTELPGGHFDDEFDIVFFYIAMPFGWNVARANFDIFGDAILAIHSQRGMDRPGWFAPFLFLSKLCVGDGQFPGLKIRRPQPPNANAWGPITRGPLGRKSTNADKLAEDGIWGPTHTTSGFTTDSEIANYSTSRGADSRSASFSIISEKRPILRQSALTQFDRLDVALGISVPQTLRGDC